MVYSCYSSSNEEEKSVLESSWPIATVSMDLGCKVGGRSPRQFPEIMLGHHDRPSAVVTTIIFFLFCVKITMAWNIQLWNSEYRVFRRQKFTLSSHNDCREPRTQVLLKQERLWPSGTTWSCAPPRATSKCFFNINIFNIFSSTKENFLA